MKKLFLVRHAKSDKDNPILPDYDRPLNERGYKDARAFSTKIKKSIGVPELIISSPAIRGISTALLFMEVFEMDPQKMILDKSLYESSVPDYLKVIRNMDNSYSSIMLFGHNPTITTLANSLAKPFTDNVPTCGIIGIEFEIKDWKDVQPDSGNLFLYDFPKNPQS
jgi:phosphohistidine phosphatase